MTKHEVICKCCGKLFDFQPRTTDTPNRDSYIECPYCGYEHVVRIRGNRMVAITTP